MPHRETRNSAPTPQFDEIPVLHLTMSPANRVLWESMRRVALSKMNPIGIPVDTPNRRVTATIKADGGVSRARIWLAGQGDPAHMDVRWPSFTVSLQAGALFRGFARFKLYNIVTQNGILDYTVASLLEDEGLFVPRKQLVNVVFNGSNLGLYIIEELAKTQGHFEGHRRYDGQIFSDGQLYAYTSGTWARKPPITIGEEFSSVVVDLIAPEAFAKTLALASRFHLTHGLERSELRFYRPIRE